VTPSRALLPILAVLTVCTIPASAQMAPMSGAGPSWGNVPSGGAPTTSAGPAWGQPQMQPQMQPQQPPPCVAEFMQLRSNVEKYGLAAKAAHEKNASREEMCKLITTFSAAEEKMIKYAATNASSCGIPAQAVGQMKTNHEHSMMIRKQICSAGPAAGPAPPTLSDALANNPGPTSTKGSGTYDSLTGNPLTR